MALAKTIIGSLGDLGVEIVKETIKAPVDIVGQAFEGGKAGKENAQQSPVGMMNESKGFPVLDRNDIPPRQILQQFVGSSAPHKEPSVYEQNQREILEKKEMQKQQKAFDRKHILRSTPSRKKRGNLYGIKEKNTEAKFNAKAE